MKTKKQKTVLGYRAVESEAGVKLVPPWEELEVDEKGRIDITPMMGMTKLPRFSGIKNAQKCPTCGREI